MGKEVFVRKASGLIRNISAWDAMIFNIMVMAPMAILVYGVWASVCYPGVHLPTTALLAIPISILVGLFYALFSVAMPRSGGDYVWVSRILHPSLGFMINFYLFLIVLSVAGAYIPWFTNWALASILEVNGLTEAATFVSTTEFSFIFAAIFYILCAVIISRGAKITIKVLWVFFILVIISLAIYAGVLLTTGPTKFAENFNALSGMNYDEVIKAAIEEGYPGEFTMTATLLGLAFTYINFLGFHCSIYLSGEIKEVHKAQFIAIIGAIVLFGFIDWLAYQAAYEGMGGLFLGALSYLYAIGSPRYTLSFDPFFMFLFRYSADPILYTIMMIGWSAMVLGAILTYIALGVRLVFAWAFDRVVPVALSKVDMRYHTPYMALIFVTIVAIVLQAAWLWTPLLSYFAYIVASWMVFQIIAAIAAILFPYRRKDIYEAAPSIVRSKIGPIPLLSLLGALTIIPSVWLGYASLSPAMIGTIDPSVLTFTIGLFFVGLILYFISSIYHRKTGIPLELSFKEIPPE
ncbi:MAG: APC family permease [Nitrososphaerota archaeon]